LEGDALFLIAACREAIGMNIALKLAIGLV